MRQLAATCGGLRRIVSIVRAGIFGLTITYALVLVPGRKAIVATSAYCVEDDAAIGRQLTNSTLDVLVCYPIPKGEGPAPDNSGAGISTSGIVR